MAIHDVSTELRDPHGEWSRGGAVLHRLGKEAASGAGRGRGAGSGSTSREDIISLVKGVKPGASRSFAGRSVTGTSDGKWRVGWKQASGGRVSKIYGTPEAAAQALHTGEHHEGGSQSKGSEAAFRRVTGGKAPGVKAAAETKTPAAPAPGVKAPAPAHDPVRNMLSQPEKLGRSFHGKNDKGVSYTLHVRREGQNTIANVHTGDPLKGKVFENPKPEDIHAHIRSLTPTTPATSAREVPTRGKPVIKSLTLEEMQKQLNAGNLTTGEIANELLRRESIRVEASNKARLPGGNVTRHDKPFHSIPHPFKVGDRVKISNSSVTGTVTSAHSDYRTGEHKVEVVSEHDGSKHNVPAGRVTKIAAPGDVRRLGGVTPGTRRPPDRTPKVTAAEKQALGNLLAVDPKTITQENIDHYRSLAKIRMNRQQEYLRNVQGKSPGAMTNSELQSYISSHPGAESASYSTELADREKRAAASKPPKQPGTHRKSVRFRLK